MGNCGEKYQTRIKICLEVNFHIQSMQKEESVFLRRLRKHVSPEANDTFVMTQGTGKCIDVYPLDQWLVFEKKLEELNPFDPRKAKFIRMILQHAAEDTLDSQSRIFIPQKLLEYCKNRKRSNHTWCIKEN